MTSFLAQCPSNFLSFSLLQQVEPAVEMNAEQENVIKFAHFLAAKVVHTAGGTDPFPEESSDLSYGSRRVGGYAYHLLVCILRARSMHSNTNTLVVCILLL